MSKVPGKLKKAASGVVLIAATTAVSSVAMASTMPEFHFLGQTLSSSSLFSPDVDIFGLAGLGDIAATSYTATFEGMAGAAALDVLSVFAVDTPFSMPDASSALGGAFFDASVVGSPTSFISMPGKYHYAVVSGIGGATGPASYNLHATAVPEAETWVMMLAGLGLIGTMIQRRRTTDLVVQANPST